MTRSYRFRASALAISLLVFGLAACGSGASAAVNSSVSHLVSTDRASDDVLLDVSDQGAKGDPDDIIDGLKGKNVVEAVGMTVTVTPVSGQDALLRFVKEFMVQLQLLLP